MKHSLDRDRLVTAWRFLFRLRVVLPLCIATTILVGSFFVAVFTFGMESDWEYLDVLVSSKPRVNLPQDWIIVFIHLPKTGGTTIRHLLERDYHGLTAWIAHDIPARSVRQVKRGKRVLYGRTSFRGVAALRSRFPRMEVKVISMLREPVMRVSSAYYFHLGQQKFGGERDLGRTKADTIGTFVADNPESSNRMYDLLCPVGCSRHARPFNVSESDWTNKMDACVITTQRVITEELFLVGVTKYFDHFVLQLKREGLLSSTLYTKRKVFFGYRPINETHPELLPTLHERNVYDETLYQTAKRKVEEDVFRHMEDENYASEYNSHLRRQSGQPECKRDWLFVGGSGCHSLSPTGEVVRSDMLTSNLVFWVLRWILLVLEYAVVLIFLFLMFRRFSPG